MSNYVLTLSIAGAIITKLIRERIDLEIHRRHNKIKKFLTDGNPSDKI